MELHWCQVLLVVTSMLVVKVMAVCPSDYTGPCQYCLRSRRGRITVYCEDLEVQALPPLPYPPEQIRALHLHYQDLPVLQEQFLEGAAGIKELVLSHNNLTILLPLAFYEVKQRLERLDLSHNALDANQIRAAFNLKYLIHLDLSYNKITALYPFDFVFKHLPQLETLSLTGNDLSSPYAFPAGVFSGLSHLTKLSLSECKISNLEPLVATGQLEGLKDLRLFGNNITTIDRCVLSIVSRLKIFDVRENPLHCDCHLLWLWDWYNNHPEKNGVVFKGHFNAATCATPPRLEGHVISEIAREELEGPGCEEDLGESRCLHPPQNV